METNFYPWQVQAIEKTQAKNAIISAPTGAGKTKVAYEWANLKNLPKNGRVFFTAPIKALSNERYMDLLSISVPVGIETGDFKKNINAPVLCCTQEIYTNKYATTENNLVVIDEFHYIAQDAKRARAYIEGIRLTDSSSKLLIMSATLGNLPRVQGYVERLAGRDFEAFQTNERAVPLNVDEVETLPFEVENALVFCFSRKAIIEIAGRIADERRELPLGAKKKIKKVASIFGTTPQEENFFGVGKYYGGLLPKEKLFVETIYRKRLIDVVVGTDALSLGVNLPAETVVFAQMAKYYEGPLKPSAFWQMAGRAGRKGLYKEGYVGYMCTPFEAFGYETDELFNDLKEADIEDFSVEIAPLLMPIITGEKSIEEEAAFVAENLLPFANIREIEEDISFNVSQIREFVKEFSEVEEIAPKKVVKKLKEIYFPEFTVRTNLAATSLLLLNKKVSIEDIIDIVFQNEQIKSEFALLLQVKRFCRNVRGINTFGLEREINSIDPTITGFEELIKKTALV